MVNKFFSYLSVLVLTILMFSCNSSGGGSHLSVAINTYTESQAYIHYANPNCSSLGGITMVGTVQENCPTGFSEITECTGYTLSFSNLNGCTDVEAVPFNDGVVMIINDCSGVITGKYNGKNGSCTLSPQANGDCNCIIDTVNVPTNTNEAFAQKITDGVNILRDKLDLALQNIFDGLVDPEEKLYDEGDMTTAGNFLFPCSNL